MAPILLFITGVLAGLIAGFLLSRVFGRHRSADGSGEIRLLDEWLLKADQGLEQFSQRLEAQSSELSAAQLQAQHDSEHAAVSRTQLEGVSQERDALKAGHDTALAAMDQLRREKEKLRQRWRRLMRSSAARKPKPSPLADPHGSDHPVPFPQRPDAGWLPRSAAQEHQGNGE